MNLCNTSSKTNQNYCWGTIIVSYSGAHQKSIGEVKELRLKKDKNII